MNMITKSFSAICLLLTALFGTACNTVQADNAENQTAEVTMEYKYTAQEMNCDIDGQNIYGIAYIPEKEGKMPLVIFAHELCSTHASGTGYAQELASRGIAVYTFDFRGGSVSSRSDGKTTEMSIMTEADDLDAVINAAGNWDFVDPQKIILLGASQGGAAAAVTAARSGEKIAGLILLYPALVAFDEVHAQFSSLDEVPEQFNFLGWIMVGSNYVSDIWDYDVYEKMKNYDKPVMIIHGSRDHIVDVSYSENAEKSYPDCKLHIIKGAGHGFYGDSFDTAMEYIVSYLKDNSLATVPYKQKS